ncbi:hypothetical protein GH714_025230 [Hevea brasiliensis]|uniref:Aldehyde dehydrogenase domain-containing protein n=1 Tax=Hevea brasiliensis TaxID=3981 RepID=A0A6A6KU39_HEVBR|nr:hypothetical protein GH714_025230 [Hevea brasiliensis]
MLIQTSIDIDATLVLDGRNIVVPRYENGNFMGPTMLFDVTVNMEWYKEEIFGPVLLCERLSICRTNDEGYGVGNMRKLRLSLRKSDKDLMSGLLTSSVTRLWDMVIAYGL